MHQSDYSSYHGLALQLNRRFSNGLQFQGAYTWSHLIDNSTADFNTTALTPRRAQDFQNLTADKAILGSRPPPSFHVRGVL